MYIARERCIVLIAVDALYKLPLLLLLLIVGSYGKDIGFRFTGCSSDPSLEATTFSPLVNLWMVADERKQN